MKDRLVVPTKAQAGHCSKLQVRLQAGGTCREPYGASIGNSSLKTGRQKSVQALQPTTCCDGKTSVKLQQRVQSEEFCGQLEGVLRTRMCD